MMFRFFTRSLLLGCLFAPVPVLANGGKLLQALSEARGGDTILLSRGDYGDVVLSDFDFQDPVVIKGDGSDNTALFRSLLIDNVRGLRVDGITVANSGNGTAASSVVAIINSHDVEFLNSEVHGLVDDVFNGHYGIYARNNTDIKISGNYVHDIKNGFVLYPNQGIEISENYVDHVGEDGFKFIGISDFLIENNRQGGHGYPSPGAHLDFIQFQGASSSDGVIRGNVFLADTQAAVQGIFLNDADYHNITIEQNIIATGMLNGIVVGESNSSGITVRDNTLINIPGIVHKATKVRIMTIGAGKSSGNFTSSFEEETGFNYQADTDDYSRIFQGDIRLGLTIEDLRPVKGSAAEKHGASDRLTELLEGASYTPDRAKNSP